jgi:hypothetical protein
MQYVGAKCSRAAVLLTDIRGGESFNPDVAHAARPSQQSVMIARSKALCHKRLQRRMASSTDLHTHHATFMSIIL